MGLSMSSSQASSKTDEQEEGEGLVGVARKSGVETDMNILAFTLEYGARMPVRQNGRERDKGTVTGCRRAASFSHSPLQRQTVARDLEQNRTRSQNVQDLDFTPTPTEATDGHYTFKPHDLLPTAVIVPFKLPFLFQDVEHSRGSGGTLRSRSSSHSPSHVHTLGSTKHEAEKAPPTARVSSQSQGDSRGGEGEEWGRQSPRNVLTRAMLLAEVLVDMARARQGPIMLRWSDLVSGRFHVAARRHWYICVCKLTFPQYCSDTVLPSKMQNVKAYREGVL